MSVIAEPGEEIDIPPAYKRGQTKMRIVTTNTVVHTEGYTYAKEHGAVMRRNNIEYEHVTEPVTVSRPQVEDFSSLVVVRDRMEYYS